MQNRLRVDSSTTPRRPTRGGSQQDFPYWPPAPAAYVTLLLDIWPPNHERDFWRSNTWRLPTRLLDKYFIAYVLANNLTLLVYVRLLPSGICPHLQYFALLYIVLGLIQSTLAACPGIAYFRWRPSLLVANRALRLLNVVLDIASCHHSARYTSRTTTLQHHIRRPGVGLLNAAARSLLMLSWTFPTLAHTLYLRFPFKLQAAVQAAYAALLVRYISVPAAHLLHDPHFAPSLSRICLTLEAFSATAVSDLSWTPARRAPGSVCAAPVVPWLLMLFVQLFLGFVLPVTVAYCGERRYKLRYIEDELRVPVLKVHWVWDPIVLAIKLSVVLAVYAALVWLLLREYHPLLAPWVVGLEWPGAASQWFHDLTARAGAR